MHNRSINAHGVARRARRHWLLLTVVALAFVALLAGQPARAADVRPEFNQTVPPPTPRPPVGSPGDNNDDNDDENAGAGSTAPAAAQTVTDTAATAAFTVTVDVLVLNVRQGPGTTFPVVGKLAQGDEVTIEGRNEAGDWYYVCCLAGSDTRGWVSAELVAPSFSPEQATALPVTASVPDPTGGQTAPAGTSPAAPGVRGTVAGVNLNVRSGPSTDDEVIGKLRGSDTVAVIGSNAGGDWLYICCVGSPAVNGWASAQFITPTFAAGELPVLGSDGQPAGAGSETATDTGAPDTGAPDTGAEAGAAGLSVGVAQQPPFAVQGREIALVYTVSNGGAAELTDVVLRSDLPGPLTLVNASAGAGGEVAQDGSAVTVTWAAVPAGESVTATVRVRVAADVPNGTTFANLAAVSAGGGETAASGITIGMPPSLLPEFW